MNLMTLISSTEHTFNNNMTLCTYLGHTSLDLSNTLDHDVDAV